MWASSYWPHRMWAGPYWAHEVALVAAPVRIRDQSGPRYQVIDESGPRYELAA